MNYKDKDYIDGSAPDDFDLDKCPVYQQWLKDQNEASLKQQLAEVMGDENDTLYKIESNTKRA